MKRFCFPFLFAVFASGCLVNSGCATVGKVAGAVASQTAIALIRAVIPQPADTTPPPPDATKAKPDARR